MSLSFLNATAAVGAVGSALPIVVGRGIERTQVPQAPDQRQAYISRAKASNFSKSSPRLEKLGSRKF